MTIVFKASKNVQDKMREYYDDLKITKTPPYAYFQANEGGTVVTLYESGKVVFQGLSADIDANMWIDQEMHLNKRDVQKEIDKENKIKDKKKKDKLDYRYYNMSTVGSDEVGTGDYFGPIVVTASYVSKKMVTKLSDLGVKDSKKLTDDKIMKLAPTLMETIPHVTYILDNKTFNAWTRKGYNMNKVKSILHNYVLTKLIKENECDYKKVIIDQFVYPIKYFEHIKDELEKTTEITFMTHAEDVCLSVGASSIISRYIFLNELDKLGKTININLPKGASNVADEVGKVIVQKYGFNKLDDVAKVNFKNTDKVKGLI